MEDRVQVTDVADEAINEAINTTTDTTTDEVNKATDTTDKATEHVTVQISDDNLLMFQNLGINQRSFETNIRLRIDPAKLRTGLESDEIIQLYEQNDIFDPKDVIVSANWEALGSYTRINTKTKKFKDAEPEARVVELLESPLEDRTPEMIYHWMWAWATFPDDRSEKIKTYLSGLPESLKHLSRDHLNFEDPVIISYLFAFLMEQMKLEYILVHYNENIYHAFGLKNVKWVRTPDPELVRRFEETRQKNLDEFATNLGSGSTNSSLESDPLSGSNPEKSKGKPIDWNSLFKLYKGMHESKPEDNTSNATAEEFFSDKLDDYLDKLDISGISKEELTTLLKK